MKDTDYCYQQLNPTIKPDGYDDNDIDINTTPGNIYTRKGVK